MKEELYLALASTLKSRSEDSERIYKNAPKLISMIEDRPHDRYLLVWKSSSSKKDILREFRGKEASQNAWWKDWEFYYLRYEKVSQYIWKRLTPTLDQLLIKEK